MASQHFCYTCLMMLIVFVVAAANSGSSDSVVEIREEVGGAAKFTCLSDSKGDLEFMYLQKEESPDPIFVNGFKAQKAVPVDAVYVNRSDVNSKSRHVNLRDLIPADEGLYYCVFKRPDRPTEHTTYKLIITANYSRPQLTEICNGSTYSVACSSRGGYPLAKMEIVLEPGAPQVTMTEQITEGPVTGPFDLSRVITLNCSQPLRVTCIVGNLSSAPLTVCPKIDPPQPDSLIIIAACVLACLLFTVALGVVLQRRRCSRSRSLVVMYSAAQRKE